MGYLLALTWFLVATLAGIGLLSLTRIRFGLAELVAYGFFAGTVVATYFDFLVCLVVGFGFVQLWLGLLLVLAAAATVVRVVPGARGRLADAWAEATGGARWRHLWLLLAVGPWLLYFGHMMAQAYVVQPDGLYAGYVNIWGDWSAHLTFADSFAYAHNFPPRMPVLPDHAFTYSFMVDFLSAIMVPGGLSLIAALPFVSLVLAVMLVAAFFLAAARLTGDRLAGWFSTLMVLAGGGFGFIYFLYDLDQHLTQKGGFIQFLTNLPREYTLDRDINYQWLNPVLAYIIPQRSILFGIPVALICLVLIREGLRDRSWWPMAFSGALLGLMPLFHLHATLTLSVVAVVMALVTAPWTTPGQLPGHIRLWLSFGVPLAVLAAPAMWFLHPTNPAGSYSFIHAQFGWLSDVYMGSVHHDGLVWFWLKNTSIIIPLALLAHILWDFLSPGLSRMLAPFWVLFLVPNLYILAPWEWDNTKFFIFWYLAAALLAAALLARLARSHPAGAGLAGVAMVLLCFTGGLDLWRSTSYSLNTNRLVTTEELQLADWVRGNTPPTAIFLTADQHNEPIAMLGGRMIFKGYPGWLFTYDLYYQPEEQVQRTIYSGSYSADALLRQNHISYVLIGPRELAGDGMSAHEDYFRLHYPIAYQSQNFRLYQVT
ncbi:MAG: hypothetical protein ACYDAY_08665 [Candidatus Dormibacteria bacterium]